MNKKKKGQTYINIVTDWICKQNDRITENIKILSKIEKCSEERRQVRYTGRINIGKKTQVL